MAAGNRQPFVIGVGHGAAVYQPHPCGLCGADGGGPPGHRNGCGVPPAAKPVAEYLAQKSGSGRGAFLPASGHDRASVKASGQMAGQGTVIRNEYGLLVLVGSKDSDSTFISACKAEILKKQDE